MIEIPTLFGDAVTTHGYSQTITLAKGARFVMTMRYNRRVQRWYLSLANAQGEPVVTGAPVVIGVNLLRQADPALNPGGTLFAAWTDDASDAHEATEFDLGSRVKLYYAARARDLGDTSAQPARQA